MQDGDILLTVTLIFLLLLNLTDFITNDTFIISMMIAYVGFTILDAIVGIGKMIAKIYNGEA